MRTEEPGKPGGNPHEDNMHGNSILTVPQVQDPARDSGATST